MEPNKTKLFFLIITTMFCGLILSADGWAQGSGSTGGSRPSYSFEVKSNLTGRITEIKVDEGVFLVFVEKEKKRYRFEIDSKTKFKADKKTELHEKKDVSFDDFQTGHTVKITYREKDGRVFEVRLKRPQEAK